MSYATITPMNVDTHFHIFDKNTISMANSRYSVGYDASIDDWFNLANKQGIAGGVIVQPSFLGFDNALLLKTIQRTPKLLRGVGSVEPKTSRKELLELKKRGVCGIRLNLFDDQHPLDTLESNQNLINLLKGLDMHLQIHHNDGLLNELLSNIPHGTKIVVDHFGRPNTDDEFLSEQLGINKHLENLWVKLSAPYRTPKINHQAIFEYWAKKIGKSRLLWGSDWPHTRYEESESYESQIRKFLDLTKDSDLVNQILSTNPRSLYWQSHFSLPPPINRLAIGLNQPQTYRLAKITINVNIRRGFMRFKAFIAIMKSKLLD